MGGLHVSYNNSIPSLTTPKCFQHAHTNCESHFTLDVMNLCKICIKLICVGVRKNDFENVLTNYHCLAKKSHHNLYSCHTIAKYHIHTRGPNQAPKALMD